MSGNIEESVTEIGNNENNEMAWRINEMKCSVASIK